MDEIPDWLEELLSRPARALESRPTRALTLAEYRALFRSEDRPSDEQCQDFVSYVSEAHSWYKHLPLVLPGKPFSFYLDPQAGRAMGWDEAGRFQVVDKPEGRHFFHYNEMPTVRYRARFSRLAFDVRAGRQVMFVVRDTVHGQEAPERIVMSDEGEPLAVPEEVLRAGTAVLTGWIHPYATELYFGSVMLRRGCLRQNLWPTETVPPEAFERLSNLLLERSEFEREHPDEILTSREWGTHPYARAAEEILEPERARLRGLALAAIHRVRGLVFD